IAENGWQIGQQRSVQRDLRSLELVFDERKRIANNGVQVRLAKLAGPGAREVEQTVDDLRRAEGLLRDFFKQRREPVVAAHLLGEHLRVRGDDGQRRIHLVRDSGGEQADGGKLFRLRKLRLQFGARGDVVNQDNA